MSHHRAIVRRFKLVGFALVTLGLLLPPTTNAFVYYSVNGDPLIWDDDPDELRASAISFPDGSSFRTALGDVMDKFNTNPSNFRFDLSDDEENVFLVGTQSEIWATDDPEDHLGYTAYTQMRHIGSKIKTADIVFNATMPWTSGTDSTRFEGYGGPAVSFRATLMHELGHAVGLYHEARYYNALGQSRRHLSTNCGWANPYLGEDASNGTVYLYGANSSAGEDVGVVHWKWAREMEWGGLGWDYSEHVRTPIRTVSMPIHIWYENGHPTYLLRSGQEIDVEVTLENNGSSRQDAVRVGFYISDNDCITTDADRRIGGFTDGLQRNLVWTTTRRITVPNDLSGSQYHYIGVIVDEEDELDEFNEANNATCLGRFYINPVPVDDG